MEGTWDLHRYAALVRHWSREGPPAYIAAAAWLGLRRPKPAASERIEGQDLVNFLAAMPGGASTP